MLTDSFLPQITEFRWKKMRYCLRSAWGFLPLVLASTLSMSLQRWPLVVEKVWQISWGSCSPTSLESTILPTPTMLTLAQTCWWPVPSATVMCPDCQPPADSRMSGSHLPLWHVQAQRTSWGDGSILAGCKEAPFLGRDPHFGANQHLTSGKDRWYMKTLQRGPITFPYHHYRFL